MQNVRKKKKKKHPNLIRQMISGKSCFEQDRQYFL